MLKCSNTLELTEKLVNYQCVLTALVKIHFDKTRNRSQKICNLFDKVIYLNRPMTYTFFSKTLYI